MVFIIADTQVRVHAKSGAEVVVESEGGFESLRFFIAVDTVLFSTNNGREGVSEVEIMVKIDYFIQNWHSPFALDE